MITSLRHLVVDSWIGRIIALLIFVAFIGWGANDVFLKPSYDNPKVLASIGHTEITVNAYDTRMKLMSGRILKAMGHKPDDTLTAPEKNQLRQIVLQTLVSDYPLRALAKSQDMRVPDEIIRASVFTIPAFQDDEGHFSQVRFRNWLQNANLTEAAFINEVRGEIINAALGVGLTKGLSVPSALIDRYADYLTQRHNFDLVAFKPAQARNKNARLDEATLHRYFDNHPWDYQTPELRHARVILLTADTLKDTITIPEAEVKTLYDSRGNQYNRAESRDFAYLIVNDQAKAQDLSQKWRGGMSWGIISKMAGDAIAETSSEMFRAAIPSPVLADLVFKAEPDRVIGPVQSPLGWVVVKVTKISPAHQVSLAQARAGLTEEIRQQQAANNISKKVAELQDAVAGDASLDHIPADLGGRPAEGTLTHDGRTTAGEIAPLPGTEAERAAILSEIFKMKDNAPPKFVALPNGGAFVVKVRGIEPKRQLQFVEARPTVEAAVRRDALNRETNTRATRLFVDAKSHGGLSNALKMNPKGAVLQTSRSATVQAESDAQDPVNLAALNTGIGETRMLEVNGTYYVFTVTGLSKDVTAAHAARKILQQRAESALRQDVVETFRQSAASKLGVHFNKDLVERVIHGDGA